MNSVDSCCFCNNHRVYGLNKSEVYASYAGSKRFGFTLQRLWGSIPNRTAMREGVGVVFSVSGHLFQFSLLIAVLVAQRSPNLCGQISSPQTCSLVKAVWPAKPELNHSWINTSSTWLALSPFNLAQTGVGLLQAPSRGGVVADRRQAKRGSSHWGQFWCVTACEEGT